MHSNRHVFGAQCAYQQLEETKDAFRNAHLVGEAAVNDYHGQRRLLHRITIEGTPLA
jgi:hypothetical protein